MEGEEVSTPNVSGPILKIQRFGFAFMGIGLGYMFAAGIYIEDAFGENNSTLVSSVLIGAGFLFLGIAIVLICQLRIEKM
jgi:hypothetical protein